MVCKIENCGLEKYKDNDECILHCPKEIYRSTTPTIMEERNQFYSAFFNFIVETICENINLLSIPQSIALTHKNQIILGSSIAPKKDISKVIEDNPSEVSFEYIHITNIQFPWVDTQASKPYTKLLEIFDEIHFDTCHFFNDSLQLNKPKIAFQDCIFESRWLLTKHNATESSLSTYYHCRFKKTVSNHHSLTHLSSTLFDDGCIFEKTLTLKNLVITANIFGDSYDSSSCSSDSSEVSFLFKKCSFDKDQEIFLSDGSDLNISLFECFFKHKFKLRGKEHDNYEKDQQNKAPLNSLKIINCKVANNDDTYLRIGFLKDCNLTIKNLRNQSNSEMNIGDCHFKRFQLTNFRNIGKFKLFKINILGKEYEQKKWITHFSKLITPLLAKQTSKALI